MTDVQLAGRSAVWRADIGLFRAAKSLPFLIKVGWMRREELEQLCYITPIENVPSIVEHGILSHMRAAKLEHCSVAMQEIQDLRSDRMVPGGRLLHEYANLYICARNPMLYKRRERPVCVLGVDVDVLDLPGVVITDQNAAGKYASFRPSPKGLASVDKERTFAEDWRHNDQIEYWRRKAAKCAEVLVPDKVPSRYLLHASVADERMKEQLNALQTELQVFVDGHLFFR